MTAQVDQLRKQAELQKKTLVDSNDRESTLLVELNMAKKKILTLENKLLESNETMQLHQKRAEENVKKFIEIQSKATEWDTQALQIEGLKKDRDQRIGDLRSQIAKLEE